MKKVMIILILFFCVILTSCGKEEFTPRYKQFEEMDLKDIAHTIVWNCKNEDGNYDFFRVVEYKKNYDHISRELFKSSFSIITRDKNTGDVISEETYYLDSLGVIRTSGEIQKVIVNGVGYVNSDSIEIAKE